MLRKLVLPLSLTLFWAVPFVSPTLAQEDTAQEDKLPEPKRYEDVIWNTVYLYDFKAG